MEFLTGLIFLGSIWGIGVLFAALYFRRKRAQDFLKIRNLESHLKKYQFENEFLRKELDLKKNLTQELSRELEQQLKIMTSEVLEEKSKRLLELAQSNFKNESVAQNELLKKRDEALQKDFKFLFDQIGKYQSELNTFEKERNKTLGSVESQVKNIIESNRLLNRQTQSLKEALTRPNLRGRWGEIQLKNCIQMAGMSEFCDVNFQQEFKQNEKTIRPDMVIQLPSGKKIIVDAKTPMEFYLKHIDEKDEALREQYLQTHAKHLKNHIRDLSSKRYSEFVGLESLDYVVLFLPNESFLFAAVEAQKDIVEYALNLKILIATPPSFVALLRAIHLGWGEHRINQNAKWIYEYSKELQKRLIKFSEHFSSLENHLEKGLDLFRKVKSSFNSRVLPQARKIESVEWKEDETLGALEPEEESSET